MICEKCGKEFEEDYRKDRSQRKKPARFCSRACANSKTFSNEVNAKRAISNAEARERFLSTKEGQKKRRKLRELTCAVCGVTFYKMNGSPKTCSSECKRALQSEIRSKVLETKGVGGFLDVKWYDIANIEGVTYKVRGTWELQYAQLLNQQKVLWNRDVHFKYRGKDTVLRTYIPDFFLPKEDRIIEVKGYFSEKDRLKLALVESQNSIQIEILLKEDLEALGIETVLSKFNAE